MVFKSSALLLRGAYEFQASFSFMGLSEAGSQLVSVSKAPDSFVVGCNKRDPEIRGDFLRACLGADVVPGPCWRSFGARISLFLKSQDCCIVFKLSPWQFADRGHFPTENKDAQLDCN